MTQRSDPGTGSELASVPGEKTAERWAGRRWAGLRRGLVASLWLLGVILAFVCYLRLARTRAVDSDGASQALQAWDMLHGNLLLHGWTVSDVSFWTTELPQYMLVELVRGLHADVVHVAAAMTYTLAVALAALLAKGRATGYAALARMLIAVGIMLAPQLSLGVKTLVSSPDHIGTSVPVMVVWLILDRARPRWYVPVLAGLLLAWSSIADSLVLFIGVLPLVLVCAFRFLLAVLAQGRAWRSQWYFLALAGAALAGGAVAEGTIRVVRSAGGFVVHPPVTHLIHGLGALPHSLTVTGQGLLLLAGADFVGLRPGVSTAAVFLHVAGLVILGLGGWVAVRQFWRGQDLVDQILVTAIAINLVAYILSTQSGSIQSTREIAAVLPFGAALAGRMLADKVLAVRRWPAVLLVVLAGYLAAFGYELVQPTVPPQNHQLTSWLTAHHLHAGLSGFWESNVVTLTSGGGIRVRQLTVAGNHVVPYPWESKATWYDAGQASADFVVLGPRIAEYPGFTAEQPVVATFGKPARTYHVGAYDVLVWHKNLLTELR